MGPWLMLAGAVLMIIGVFIRPRDEPWEWVSFWGLAGGSTWLGKTVVVLGVVALVLGARMATSTGGPTLPSSAKTKCFVNLGKIGVAKDMLAVSDNLAAGTDLTPAQVEKMGAMIPGGWPAMKCGSGGTYEVGKVGASPRCTVHDRKAP